VIRPARGRMSILVCIKIRFIYMIFFCMLDLVSLSINAAATSTKKGMMTTLTSTRIRRGRYWPMKRVKLLSSTVGVLSMCL